jgi:hypothetical protein
MDEIELKKNIKATLESGNPTLSKIKDHVVKSFNEENGYNEDDEDYYMLGESDASLIEVCFSEIILELFKIECEKIIKDKVENSRRNVDDLIVLSAGFKPNTNLDTLPDYLKVGLYKNIKEEDEQIFDKNEIESMCIDLAEFLKSKVKEVLDGVENEFNFLKNLIEVLKSSFLHFDEILKAIKLKDFVENKINIKDVARLITASNFTVNFYSELKKQAEKIQKIGFIALEKLLREEIAPYIAPVEKTELLEENKKILKISAKILIIQNDFEVDKDVKEVRFVGEVIHVASDLTLKTIDNLLLIADVIKIHDSVTFDLRRAVEAPSDIGVSGNCLIICSSILNFNRLRLELIGNHGIQRKLVKIEGMKTLYSENFGRFINRLDCFISKYRNIA